jgi:DNA polymerase I-like protein with 3'-5' exonuclease and polymerase domains
MTHYSPLEELLHNDLPPCAVDIETEPLGDDGVRGIDKLWAISWSYDGVSAKSVYWKNGISFSTLKTEFELCESNASFATTATVAHYRNLMELKKLLSGKAGYIPCFHNSGFDKKLLSRSIYIPYYHDSQVLGYCLLPPAALGSTGEEDALRFYSMQSWGQRGFCDVKMAHDDFTQFSEQLLERNQTDAVSQQQLSMNLMRQVRANAKTWGIYIIDLCATESIIQRIGVSVDQDKVTEISLELQQQQEQLLYNLQNEYPAVGVKVVKSPTRKQPQSLTRVSMGCYPASDIGKYVYLGEVENEFQYLKIEEFNPNSSAHVAYVLQLDGWEPKTYTKAGNVSVSADVLKDLQGEYPSAAKVLDYREVCKLDGTFIKAFRKSDQNGRVHPDFLVLGTRTGRLSSRNPNFQNIPKDKCRELIIAPKGKKLVCVDLSQIELRILAWYMMRLLPEHVKSRDYLWSLYHAGADVHDSNRIMMGLDENERRLAKIAIFLYIYGGGAFRLQQSLRISAVKAKSILSNLEKRVPALPMLKKTVLSQMDRDKCIKTMYGRTIIYPDYFNGSNSRRKQAERQIFNSLIQGTQADIIKILMYSCMKVAEYYGGYLLMQVHDELVYEMPEGNAGLFAERIYNKFNNHKLLPGLPVRGVPGIGSTWEEAKNDGERREKEEAKEIAQ